MGQKKRAAGVRPFGSSLEHLRAELVRLEVALAATQQGDGPADRAPWPWGRTPGDAATRARLEESLRQGRAPRLIQFAAQYELTELEVALVLICVAPEVDLGWAAAYGQLLAEPGRRWATVGLATRLLAPTDDLRQGVLAATSPGGRLIDEGLLLGPGEGPPAALLARELRASPALVAFLFDLDVLPDALALLVRAPAPCPSGWETQVVPAELRGAISRWCAHSGADLRAPALLYVQAGAPGCAGGVASVVAQARRLAPWRVDGAALAQLEPRAAREVLTRLCLESRLRQRVLLWEHFDAALGPERHLLRLEIGLALRRLAPWVVASGQAALEPARGELGVSILTVRPAAPAAAAQVALWELALGQGPRGGDVDLASLVAAHSLPPASVLEAAALARELARWRREGEAPHQRDLLDACRRLSTPHLGQLAQRVPTGAPWARLILAPRTRELLEELAAQARHRPQVMAAWGFAANMAASAGIRALFTGPPGTGKTLAASVIAGEMGVDLYRIDLSSVVSKYIGETEKHLGQLFDEAAQASAILFFDEADALFARRTEVKDSHDRYANLETSYLLQRMEVYEGLVILASNLRANLDPAFVRRMSFIVPFEEPGPQERLAIWRAIWPPQAPLGSDIDLALLAQRFELTGGMIRNVVLAAAYRAAAEGGVITMGLVLAATQREMEKAGRMVDVRMFQAMRVS